MKYWMIRFSAVVLVAMLAAIPVSDAAGQRSRGRATDIAVTSVTSTPVVTPGETVTLEVTVENPGPRAVSVTVSYSESPGGDTGDGSASIGAGDAEAVSLDWIATTVGEHTFEVDVSGPDDPNPANNTGTAVTQVVSDDVQGAVWVKQIDLSSNTVPGGVMLDGAVHLETTDSSRSRRSRSGFLVTVEFSGPLGSETREAVTTGGVAEFTYGPVGNGEQTLTVLDVSKDGYTYQPGANVMTQRSITTELPPSIYVADSGNNRIQQFTLDGEFIRQWGSQGSEPGQFDDIYRVAVDDQGNVYVTDALNCRVQKFAFDGTFLTSWGTCGEGPGQFLLPSGITVDSQGNVYVGDFFSARVQKFDSDGNYLDEWGSDGDGPGQFTIVSGMATDSQNNVYVVDFNPLFGSRVQKFDGSGNFLDQWDGPFGIESVDIDIGSEGNLHVVDSDSEAVAVFTPDLTSASVWSGSGYGIDEPQGISVGSAGRIYVSNRGNNTIQVWDKVVPGDFDQDSALLQWGSTGSGPGQFDEPIGIAVYD